MSTATDMHHPLSSVQPRRFACDRCHRHKLKCERNPFIGNGSIIIPLGPCKRCTKANAECQTTNNSLPTSDKELVLKGKTPPPKDGFDNRPITSGSSPCPAVELVTDGTVFGDSPCEGSGISGNGTPLPIFDNFDFETGPYTSGEGVLAAMTPMSLDLAAFTAGMFKGPLDGDEDPNTNACPDLHYEELTHTPRKDTAGPIGSSAHHIDTASACLQPSPPGSPDDVRTRVLQLHSFLFTQLYNVTEANLTDALFTQPNPSLSSSEAIGPGANIIQCVLHASERLLDLLAVLCPRQNGSRKRAHDSAFSVPTTKRNASSSFDSRRRSMPRHLLSQQLKPRAENDPGASRASGELATPSVVSSLVDLPTMTSFLTCHVGILSVYRTVFMYVEDALRACETTGDTPAHARHGSRGFASLPPRPLSSSSKTTTAAVAAAAAAAGQADFLGTADSLPLSFRHVLGLRIQLEVMTHMLDRMEGAWAAAFADRHDSAEQRDYRSLFGSEATLQLLQSMLAHEGYESADDDCGTGLGALIGMVNDIRRLLRRSGTRPPL